MFPNHKQAQFMGTARNMKKKMLSWNPVKPRADIKQRSRGYWWNPSMMTDP